MPGWGKGGRPKGEHWPPGKNKPKPPPPEDPPSDPPPEGSGSYDDEYSEDYDRLTDANP